MALPLMRKCRCMFTRCGASRLRLLMRPRVATYYVKPKDKKGPSGQAWALLAGVTASIAGLSIYVLGMKANIMHICMIIFIKLKRLIQWGWSDILTNLYYRPARGRNRRHGRASKLLIFMNNLPNQNYLYHFVFFFYAFAGTRQICWWWVVALKHRHTHVYIV